MPPENKPAELRLTLDDGTLLRFSSSLLSFLANRQARRPFRLGDWLQSLDEETLAHLRELAERALYDPGPLGPALDDLLSVVVHALGAEREAPSVSFREEQIPEYIATLQLVATMERLRRRGLMRFESPLSIDPAAPNRMILSEEAFGLEEDIRRQLMRGMH